MLLSFICVFRVRLTPSLVTKAEDPGRNSDSGAREEPLAIAENPTKGRLHSRANLLLWQEWSHLVRREINPP